MTGFKFLIFLLTISLICINTFAQQDLCECCSYSTIQFKSEFQEIVPKSVIQNNQFKEVVIFVKKTDSISTSGSDENKYLEAKLNFNENGFLISKIEYYKGKPSHLYEYERNTSGQLLREEFSYLKSETEKSEFSPDKITDYSYDNQQNLVKKKVRDSKGNIIADEKSEYTKFKYNDLNQLIQEKRYAFYSDKQIFTHIKEYKEFKNNLPTKYVSTYNGKPFGTGVLTYDEQSNLVKDYSIGVGESPAIFEKTFKYNEFGRLIEVHNVSSGNYYDECPENGNFTDLYLYGENGFIERIVHSFKQNVCEMIFDFME